MKNILKNVCEKFCIEGDFLGYKEILFGNVNKTYCVHYRKGEEDKYFLLQKVNTYVFKNPVEVMNNIDAVTEHIREKNGGSVSLHFHHTADRKTYYMDGDGFWRLMNFIPSVTFNTCDDLEIVRAAGVAFGDFQAKLSDFDASKLYETIPDFHNTRKRFEKFREDVAADPIGKRKEVQDEIDWLLSVEDDACKLSDMGQSGELPLRVTHNDTKVNNVLFDPLTKNAITVIDLDTVMPGLVGNDFGDAVRFVANKVEEDSKDYEKAGINLDIFGSFAEGFLSKVGASLVETEKDMLAHSVFSITVELAVRFLDDYILGSPYFKINYPEHNLVRARCQIALAKDVWKNLPQMREIVDRCFDEQNNK